MHVMHESVGGAKPAMLK